MRKTEKVELLRNVVAARQPELLPLIDKLDGLSDSEINKLTSLIGDEFMETGLREDSEPNERGLQLEEVIDLLISHLGETKNEGGRE
jgi:hypothetical protein